MRVPLPPLPLPSCHFLPLPLGPYPPPSQGSHFHFQIGQDGLLLRRNNAVVECTNNGRRGVLVESDAIVKGLYIGTQEHQLAVGVQHVVPVRVAKLGLPSWVGRVGGG